ncbi:hypothetical protein Tco_1182105 [Tanacetum coccineum]
MRYVRDPQVFRKLFENDCRASFTPPALRSKHLPKKIMERRGVLFRKVLLKVENYQLEQKKAQEKLDAIPA